MYKSLKIALLTFGGQGVLPLIDPSDSCPDVKADSVLDSALLLPLLSSLGNS